MAERGVIEGGSRGERGRGEMQTGEGEWGKGRSNGATDSGRMERPKQRAMRERQCTMQREGASERNYNRRKI